MPTPTYLSNDQIRLVLRARETNDVSICCDVIADWIDHRVKMMVKSVQLREDIAADCMLFFLEKIFPKIEIRALPPTSKYLARRINMYIREKCNTYKKKALDVSSYSHQHRHAEEFDQSAPAMDEMTEGGPTFTRVIRMLMDGKRQFEIARELGISRQRVWQLKQKMARRWRRSE